MSFPHSSGLEIFKFIIEGIRNEDAKNGDFLKRFLTGPQDVWEQIESRMFEYLELWDVINVEDKHLKYLKTQVGWTKDLNHITDAVDDTALRRLIANAIDIWKYRGTEDQISDLISFATGARNILFDWFYYRNLLDERSLGDDYWISDSFEDEDGGDSEHTMLLKIVDDGTLNKQLVNDLATLMRPFNETIAVLYYLFIDHFTLDGDDSQWFSLVYPTESVNIVDGEMIIDTVQQMAYIDVEGSGSWSEYSCRALCKVDPETDSPAQGAAKFFFYLDNSGTTSTFSDNYSFGFNVNTNQANLYKQDGSSIPLTSANLINLGITIYPGVYYEYIAETIAEPTGLRIRCYLDNNLIFNYLDTSPLSGGSCGVYNGGDSTLSTKEFEVRPIPVETDII